MYHYLDNERLQMAFYSPNTCGIFLVMLALICCGVLLWTDRKIQRTSLRIFCEVPLFAVIISLFIGIGMTYSRGAWLACLGGLLLFLWLTRSLKSVSLLLLFLLLLIPLPDSGKRAASSFQLKEKSILHRLYLWRGGCAMIADNWVHGVGAAPAPGIRYAEKYRPDWIRADTFTLVSDPLTVGASYGIFALYGWLLLLGWPLHGGFLAFFRRHNPLIAGILCAVCAYGIAGLFSTLFNELLPFLLILQGLLCLAAFRGFRTDSPNRKRLLLTAVPAGAAVLCLLLLTAGAGFSILLFQQ